MRSVSCSPGRRTPRKQLEGIEAEKERTGESPWSGESPRSGAKKKWKAWAGREDGKDAYRFGDLLFRPVIRQLNGAQYAGSKSTSRTGGRMTIPCELRGRSTRKDFLHLYDQPGKPPSHTSGACVQSNSPIFCRPGLLEKCRCLYSISKHQLAIIRGTKVGYFHAMINVSRGGYSNWTTLIFWFS
jgi:hypothetical protein